MGWRLVAGTFSSKTFGVCLGLGFLVGSLNDTGFPFRMNNQQLRTPFIAAQGWIPPAMVEFSDEDLLARLVGQLQINVTVTVNCNSTSSAASTAGDPPASTASSSGARGGLRAGRRVQPPAAAPAEETARELPVGCSKVSHVAATGNTRFYCVWVVPGHPWLRGVHAGEGAACYRRLESYFPGQRYKAGEVHFCRCDSLDEAVRRYESEAPRYGALVPGPLYQWQA